MKNKFFYLVYFFIFFYCSKIEAQYSVIIKYSEKLNLNDIESAASKNLIALKTSFKSNLSYELKQFFTYENYNSNKTLLDNFARYFKVTFKSENDARSFFNIARKDPNISYVDFTRKFKICGHTSSYLSMDPYLNRQWHLFRIKAIESWRITEGSEDIIVAIIDTGLDYHHEDLKDNIFINKKETYNGLDDDANGFIDDVSGYDFVDRKGFPYNGKEFDFFEPDNDPYDEHGHGTAVAGIIAAVKDNGTGISGLAPKVKLLNVRAFDKNGEGEEDDVAAAVLYSVLMKAKVINMSFGDDKFSFLLYEVIKYAYEQGVVLIASSGNSNSKEPHYPSGFPEVISVGAVDRFDSKASFSNYGSSLDLCAPGVDIFTTAKNNDYAFFSGTSASAPIVSACAALILSKGNYSPDEIKQILKNSADDIGISGWDEKTGAGIVNFYKALKNLTNGIIKFDFPKNNQVFYKENNLPVSVTIVSPYFKNFSLYISDKNEINAFRPIVENIQEQMVRKNIANIDLTNYKIGSYELKLKVFYNNGNFDEETVNFYISDDSIETEIIFFGVAEAGSSQALMAACYSKRHLPVKLYYKNEFDSSYSFIFLDGVNSYVKFASKINYGFVSLPASKTKQTYYSFLASIDFDGREKIISDIETFELNPLQLNYNYIKTNYSLKSGQIFENQISLDSPIPIIAYYSSDNPTYIKFAKYNNDDFSIIDSIKRRPKYFGALNSQSNSKYLISILGRTGYIDKLIDEQTLKFQNIIIDNNLWFAGAYNLFKDDKKYIIAFTSDKSFAIYSLDIDDKLVKIQDLYNFADNNSSEANFDFAKALVLDIDGDEKNEITLADTDGNILIYKHNDEKLFAPFYRIKFNLSGTNKLIDGGDFDGDGKNEIAIILFSNSSYANAPFAILKILKFSDNQPEIILEKAFIDYKNFFPGSFISLENSMRFFDLDNDGTDELLLSIYPNFCVYKYFDKNKSERIFFQELSNSSSIFIGDLNQNSKLEFSIASFNSIDFIELNFDSGLKTPRIIDYFAQETDTDTSVFLRWIGEEESYFVYAGEDANNLFQIAETNLETFSKKYDRNLKFWAVKAIKNQTSSAFSNIVEPEKFFYSNKIINVEKLNEKTIAVEFNSRINIENFHPLRATINDSLKAETITQTKNKVVIISFDKEIRSAINRLTIFSKYKKYEFVFSTTQTTREEYFYVKSTKALSKKEIKITFNLPVDETIALNLNSYEVSNNNKVEVVNLSDDKTATYILFKNSIVGIGKETILRLKNFKSSIENGALQLAPFSTTIAIAETIEDLTEVFVYPNPAKSQMGKITFANLPKICDIYIYDFNGNLIQTIRKNSNETGIEWNLKDRYGRTIYSGIYFYLVKYLTEGNFTKETKLNKFAIIK